MSVPLRVACFLHSALTGGERVVLRLLSAFDRTRIEPVAVLPAEGPLRAELEALPIHTRVLPMGWWVPGTHWTPTEFLAQLEGLPARGEQAAALLAEERIGLVHTQFVPTLEGALGAARLGLPHVWHSRGLFGGGFPPAWFDDVPFLLSVVDQLSDAIICVSRSVEQQTTTGGRAERYVIYDGFDRDTFLARPVSPAKALRERYGLDADTQVIAVVGGIQRRKGQMDLVDAAVVLASEFPRLVFALAGDTGDTDYLKMMKARMAAAGVTRHFRLLGFQRDIRELFSVSYALAHPSHSEGWGLAILEAMAAGLPVVATRSGGPEEIVEDGVSGLLVPVADPPALATAVRRLLTDADAAAAMGHAGRERAGAFTLSATARQTEEAYRSVMATHATSGDHRERPILADALVAGVLSRARRAAAIPLPTDPPPALRSPQRNSWLSRLRRRVAGSRP